MSCTCDKDENYLCFYCECYLKDSVKDLIHEHKNEILETKDWWWAIDNAYDVNIFCYEDDCDHPEARFEINLYKLNRGDTSSYEQDAQYSLPHMTRMEIRLL